MDNSRSSDRHILLLPVVLAAGPLTFAQRLCSAKGSTLFLHYAQFVGF